MTDPVIPLLAFCLWTLVLAAIMVTGRSLLVLTGRARAHDFPAYQYNPDHFLDRVSRAYLNALETLPLFAALILAAWYTRQLELAISPALWILLARIGQSMVHLIGVNHWLVLVRFSFFLIQLVLMAVLAWNLLSGWVPY